MKKTLLVILFATANGWGEIKPIANPNTIVPAMSASGCLQTNASGSVFKANCGTTQDVRLGGSGGLSMVGQLIADGSATVKGAFKTQGTVDMQDSGLFVGVSTFSVYQGNIGVGLGTPGLSLPSGYSTAGGNSCVHVRSVTSSRDAGIFLRRSDDALGLDLWQDGSEGTVYMDNRRDTATDGHMFFRLRTAGTPQNAFTLMSDNSAVFAGSATVKGAGTFGGSVGIGTASPATTFDVNGNAQFGSSATKSTFTATGFWMPISKTKAQVDVLVPTAVGQYIFCSNCTVPGLCVSSGTVASQWRRDYSGTVGCGTGE